MSLLLIGGALVGATLGLRFKVIVLLPAISIAALGVGGFAALTGMAIALALVNIIVAVTALQVGYLGGLAVRSVIAAGRLQPQAAPAAPPPPQPIRTEILAHDNWTVTCREFADKRKTCSGVLQVVQQQNNQVLFVWIVGRNAEQKLMSVLQTPTGVALAPGVEVKLAKGPVRKAVFVNCESNRCEATLDLDDAFVRDASATESVDATVVSTSGQSVKFTMPFKGFDKAVAAVR